ncbi:hypothetical protein RUND412_003611 [Rhizina undulata]
MATSMITACLLVLLFGVFDAHSYSTLPPVEWDYSTSRLEYYAFWLDQPVTLYLDASAANISDGDGMTLIPPTALEFMETFAEDLRGAFRIPVELKLVDEVPRDGVYLRVIGDCEETFTNQSDEGYELEVTGSMVVIAGGGARGLWWGTRTLLQELLLEKGIGRGRKDVVYLKAGEVRDAPAYPTRGFMLDAGRKWYNAQFLKDLCTYASFFKFSEFQYHASDNYPLNRGRNETWQNVYSQFSLLPTNPELLPLVQRPHESLNRSEFEDFQAHCASRGITVIPEIESPGHALAITKWKPQLALADNKDLLNLTHPETIPIIKSIWSEFLPWFQTKEVHIGADEYDSRLADVYIDFVNEMSDFVASTSGKKIRIWGTNEPSDTKVVLGDITIQHWQYGESDPVALERAGYDVINSEDWWAYTSLKNDHMPILPAPYPQYFNVSRILNFGNVPGLQWEPSLYNPFNVSEEWQLPKNSSRNRGAIMAAWNDNGPDATTQLEAYYSFRDALPIIGARAWSGYGGSEISAKWESSRNLLAPAAPGQNLDRRIPKQAPGEKLLDYSWTPAEQKKRRDLAIGSKGMNYTVELIYNAPFTLSSSDATISLLENGTLLFAADEFQYPLRSVAITDGYDPGAPGRIWTNATTSTHEIVTLPVSTRTRLVVRGDEIGGTRLWVDGILDIRDRIAYSTS